MHHLSFNRASAELAAEMLALFGTDAPDQARARARTSRDRGNVQHFCNWRQAERLLKAMTITADGGSVH